MLRPFFPARVRYYSNSARVSALLLPLLAVLNLSATDLADGKRLVAPSALKRMSVEELLAQTVISTVRRPETWSEAASNVFLIRGQTVSSTGATVLPDLLRMAPTLFVAQKSSSEWAVNARGFVRTNASSNKLLVMIDGRTVYSPLFSNVFWEANSVFLPDLERIEVISGPAGANWGSNAVNGVINIQTKSAHETLGGLVTATAGTETNNFGVRYGTSLGKNGAMRIYAQGAEHEGTRSATGVDDDADPWKSTQVGFRADWGDATTGEFTLQSDLFANRYEGRPLPAGSNDAFNLLARWSRSLSPDSQLWIRAYHDYTRRNTQEFMVEVSHSTDLEFQHHLKLSDTQDLTWGGDYRLMEDSISRTVGFVILPPDLDFSLGSGFAQHEIRFYNDALKLTTGLRLEHNYFSGWEYQPNIRLAWKRPSQLLWVAASRASRIPSRLDSGFFAPATPPYFVTGGPDFRAEIVEAFELGWRGQPMKDVSLTATAYYNNYDHLRSVEPAPVTVIPFTTQNLVAGRSYGLELFADWDVNAWWRLRAGGFSMHQETWRKTGGADNEGGQGEASFPEYQLQLRNSFRFGKSVIWWTSLRRVAEVTANEGGNGVVPAYTELDMCLSWNAWRGVDFSLTGRNLLHPSHPEIGGATARREIARSGEASVRWQF